MCREEGVTFAERPRIVLARGAILAVLARRAIRVVYARVLGRIILAASSARWRIIVGIVSEDVVRAGRRQIVLGCCRVIARGCRVVAGHRSASLGARSA